MQIPRVNKCKPVPRSSAKTDRSIHLPFPFVRPIVGEIDPFIGIQNGLIREYTQ